MVLPGTSKTHNPTTTALSVAIHFTVAAILLYGFINSDCCLLDVFYKTQIFQLLRRRTITVKTNIPAEIKASDEGSGTGKVAFSLTVRVLPFATVPENS